MAREVVVIGRAVGAVGMANTASSTLCLNDTFAFFLFFSQKSKYSELCCCLFSHFTVYTELSLADFSLNLQSILESYFVFILHCAPLHVHHLFAVRTAVPRGQTAVSTSSNTAPRSLSVFIFQDTSLPTPQLTFPILLTLTLIFPNPFLYYPLSSHR